MAEKAEQGRWNTGEKNMKLDFVRGHMGGNLIILLQGEQIPGGQELDVAVKLMEPNYLHAHEAGILYPTDKPGEIDVKIAEPTLPCFISACGGFTQVLGAALIETDLGFIFGVNRDKSPARVMLYTDCGPTELTIEFSDKKAMVIRTDMQCFVEECYERGVGPIKCAGFEAMQAGKFLIVNAERFKEHYPGADFVTWDAQTREALLEIQHDFQEQSGEIEPNVALYDWTPQGRGQIRVVFPHYVKDDFFEPSCGTGSVALGLALHASGELKTLQSAQGGQIDLAIESGGGIELGGPEITSLEMKIGGGQVEAAAFSHSKVEITAVGEARF